MENQHELMLVELAELEKRGVHVECTPAYMVKYGHTNKMDTGTCPSDDDTSTNKQPDCIHPSRWCVSSRFSFLFEMEI